MENEIQDIRDIVFEIEYIELDSMALKNMYQACESYILQGIAPEEMESILYGIYLGVYELSRKLQRLKDRGFEILNQQDKQRTNG